MAYGDYTGTGGAKIQPQQTAVQPQRYTLKPPLMDLMSGATPSGDGAQPQPAQDGALPTNTRQQNLQQVQQAYARMPGDMNALNGLIGQSSSPVSENDPSIAPAFAAGRVADQRNIERQRAALAEQLGGSGLGSSGAMQTKTGGIQQRVGEQQALRESGMLYDEGNARRNALLQALGLDQQRYGADNNIGLRLAELEAQLNQNAVQPFF
jgi:hypothetical protein